MRTAPDLNIPPEPILMKRLTFVCVGALLLFSLLAGAQTAASPEGAPRTLSSAVAAPGWLYGPAYSTALLPTAAAIGDFNRDQHLDLAVASDSGTGFNGAVSVLLGNGDG